MTTYTNPLSKYVTELFAVQDEALKRAQRSPGEKGLPAINVTAEEGRFLQFLCRASGGRRALEIGALGGYSGIWIGRGLAPGGKLISLELEPYHAEVARDNLTAAGLQDRVEVRVGNAHDLLEQLSAEISGQNGEQSGFDFIFIDAEKRGYPQYLTWAIDHLRTGGILAAHNAFSGGRVVKPEETSENVEAIRASNRLIANEPRLISTIFPGGDGTLIAVKVA